MKIVLNNNIIITNKTAVIGEAFKAIHKNIVLPAERYQKQGETAISTISLSSGKLNRMPGLLWETRLVCLRVGGEILRTTPGHPFYVTGRGFVRAGDLKAGEWLCDIAGNAILLEKVRFEVLEQPVRVYDFQVADFHTYHVGRWGVLVHNAGNGYGEGESKPELTSSIDKDPRLVKAAEEMGKNERVQQEANHVIDELLKGNENPGLGSKNLFKDVSYLRVRNGARVFYTKTATGYEILGKADKANEQIVINILKKLYE